MTGPHSSPEAGETTSSRPRAERTGLHLRLTGVVTRAGPEGQLGRLLRGTAVQEGDLPARGLVDPTAAVEAFAEEAARLRDHHPRGQASTWLDDYEATIGNLGRVRVWGRPRARWLPDGWSHVRDRGQPAIDAFSPGLSVSLS